MSKTMNNNPAMAVENYKYTTWEALEDDLMKLAYSFGNDYYNRAYNRVNQTFDHDAYGDESKHNYNFYNQMKEAILSLVLEDIGLYPFISNNAPFTDADRRISPYYNSNADFHDAFSIVDGRYVGIEFKCRNYLDKLKLFNGEEGLIIVGKMYKEANIYAKYTIPFNGKKYYYEGRPYKLGGVIGCSQQQVIKGSMWYYDDRENLVARNYAHYLNNACDNKYTVDGSIDNVTSSFNADGSISESQDIEHFQSLGLIYPMFHLVYNVGNNIYIYNMNYLLSDYRKGYLKKDIREKPVSTQMDKGFLPHDVFEIPLSLVDQYVVEDGRIVKHTPRNSKLINEELKVLPIIVEEVPNDPISRLEWNYKNFQIATNDEIIDAQIAHGGYDVDVIELSYEDILDCS